MSESEFYMQCEEEELAPCQSNIDKTNQIENIQHVHNGHGAALPEQIVPPVPTVQSAAIKTAILPFVPGSIVPQQLLAGVLQSIQIPAGGKGQPIYIASKLSSGDQQNIATPVGYILPTGQAVTFLTPTQTGSLISTQLLSPASTPKPAAVQIPVTFLQTPSSLPNITTVNPSGTSVVGISPSNSLPLTSVAAPELPSTSSSAPPLNSAAAAADQTQNSTMQSTSQSVASISSLRNHAQTQKTPFSPQTVSPKVFQNVSKVPQFCSHCKVAYKVVRDLRGYMCHCNPELINSVHALTTKPRLRARRAKRMNDQTHLTPYEHEGTVSPTSSLTSVSSRHPAASPSPTPPCLKNITTLEIPEGVQSPGTGDYDSQGKLIMLVEDFYYGKDPGHPVLIENNQVPARMKCHLCDKKLKNNIKLMNHMKHHIEMDHQRADEKSHTMCQHCFRNFSTPFSLQCHLETVHSQVESASLCKICELSFDNTPLFLHHMKNFHKPGEMPYECQVCKFRSSFYYDVIIHFRELHKDTANLLCPYCLKVFRSCNSYQLHYNKHQKKSVLHCDMCRLQFLYAKDKADHKVLFHQTYRKPVQLLGLKPGTKITIRAYSVTKFNDNTHSSKPAMNTESSSASPVPAPQSVARGITPAKRKPVESILEVMTKFQKQCEPSRSWLCIECNFKIPDFSTHFPTFVHCSLCRYSTCCSRAYANHMISNHVPRKTSTKYLNLYKPCPKLGIITCSTCAFSTKIGDMMATHLAQHPTHAFSHCKFNEGFSSGYKRFVFIPSHLIQKSHVLNSGIIIQKQMGPNSLPQISNSLSNHCTNLPASSEPPSEVQPVAESTVHDDDCGTQTKELTLQKIALSTQAEKKPEGSLTVAQLKTVLYALCFGIPQAASQFDCLPENVQLLLLKKQLQLGPPKSKDWLVPQASDWLAEWVLCQREQQLPVDETSFFTKAAQLMSANGGPGISYGWAVDFLINHDLSLQSLANSRRLLPHKVQERLQTFTSVMRNQVSSRGLGRSAIAAMDELSIFIDIEQLDPASADSFSMLSAFKLVGDKDPFIDVLLATLADGTILPTVVFLRGEPASPDAPALPDIILEAKPEGFSDEERLQLWFDKVWSRHIKSNSGSQPLMLMDPYRGHLSSKFLVSLGSVGTLPGIIPHACSSRLQPLEACVGVVLREFLQARWCQQVTEAPQELIGAVPADLAILISAWLLEMLDVLAERPEFLQRSFEPVLSSNTDFASEGFSELVQNLTKALMVSANEEQESSELRAEGRDSVSVNFSASLFASPSNPPNYKENL